ncbi:regulatory protein RecX [Niabella terrae]
MPGSFLTKEQALQKLRHYCAYSERCHSDVISRLYELGVRRLEHDEIIASLIQDDYLNEERFAMAFAGGHFRQKQWGRNKIRKALLQKNISAYCLKKAMGEIDPGDYQQTLQKLFEAKWASLKTERNRFIRMKKTRDYLLQKGFEADQVQALFDTNR